MQTEKAFTRIDNAINELVLEKQAVLHFIVETKAKSDWLVFDYRKLEWGEAGLKKTIELYPEFERDENSKAWVLSTSAFYDEESNRYYLSQKMIETDSIDKIADSIVRLLDDAFNYLDRLKKEDIPLAAKIH